MLSRLQSKNVIFFFPEASCEAWFSDVNSSVFKSSSVAGSGGMVSSYSSPLLWGERGWEGEIIQAGSVFSLTEVLCCVTDKSQIFIYICIYIHSVFLTYATWHTLK